MQSAVSVGIFLLLLACVPVVVKWYKQRSPGGSSDVGGQARFISALAVGPHQRVVTVEVGPEGRRVWLTLGVTAQEISCLHCADVSDVSVNPNPGVPALSPEPNNLRGTETM